MVSCLHELTALENEPDVFVARFWRDFYRPMLANTVRKALGKVLVFTVGAPFYFSRRIALSQPTA
jgi:hypothetical protein